MGISDFDILHHLNQDLTPCQRNFEMAASSVLMRLSALPPELKAKIFSYLRPDLQTLCPKGHILVTRDRTVSLLSGMMVQVFLVSGGSNLMVSDLFRRSA